MTPKATPTINGDLRQNPTSTLCWFPLSPRRGEMDNFLKHFKEDIMVLHQKIGVPIVGTWVNRPQNEFIWVRTYKDKAELEAKNKEFQAAVAAAGVKLGGNVAKMEVREAESAFA